MKGTKLWQAPGSPIIQGRSRTERPFWERWLGGVVGAEAIVLVGALLLALREPRRRSRRRAASVVVSYLLPALPGVRRRGGARRVAVAHDGLAQALARGCDCWALRWRALTIAFL